MLIFMASSGLVAVAVCPLATVFCSFSVISFLLFSAYYFRKSFNLHHRRIDRCALSADSVFSFSCWCCMLLMAYENFITFFSSLFALANDRGDFCWFFCCFYLIFLRLLASLVQKWIQFLLIQLVKVKWAVRRQRGQPTLETNFNLKSKGEVGVCVYLPAAKQSSRMLRIGHQPAMFGTSACCKWERNRIRN